MNKAWMGPMVAGLVVLGVVAILVLNIQPAPKTPTTPVDQGTKAPDPTPEGGNVREYPIGDPVTQNHIQVAAVWLEGVTMDGMNSPGGDIIHIEADVKSLDNNPNGFAKDEFVPYMKISYTIEPASGGPALDKGTLYPMIAGDGLHYGANIGKPKPGNYRLLFDIEPPSAGGLGRHVGKGGVAAWWSPFQASFDWTMEAATPSVPSGSR